MAKKKDNIPEFDPDDYPDYDGADFMDYAGGYEDFDMSSFWQEPDFILADIVHLMVNLAGLEIGVTLFVKGMTITGVLTSEENYLKDLSDTFRRRVQVNKQHMTKAEQEEFDSMFDFTHLGESTISQQLDEEGIHVPSRMASIRFLHIKNPLLVVSQGVVNFAHGDAPYIRLRLSMIDGWMLGEAVTPDLFLDDDDENEVLH